eukprot:4252340-Amphidinium_carterae.3
MQNYVVGFTVWTARALQTEDVPIISEVASLLLRVMARMGRKSEARGELGCTCTHTHTHTHTHGLYNGAQCVAGMMHGLMTDVQQSDEFLVFCRQVLEPSLFAGVCIEDGLSCDPFVLVECCNKAYQTATMEGKAHF